MIGKDSPFRTLPAELDPRQRLILDGIRYSAEMADLGYDRLRSELLRFAQMTDAGSSPGSFAAAFSDAWTIVDSTNRLRLLVRLLPKADQAMAIQEFLGRTDVIRRLRDSVQHLHARFEKLVKLREPTWGVITWVTVVRVEPFLGKLHMIVAGSISSGQHALDNPLGCPVRVPIDFVRLSAHRETVLLTETLDSIRSLIAFLEANIAPQFTGQSNTGADIYVEVKLEGNSGPTAGRRAPAT